MVQVPVIVIFAPTACGKTALTRSIFGRSSLSHLRGKAHVLSADSQAVYRHMDIGTAKPSQEEQEDIPHHIINLASPDTQFDVGNFVQEADRLCQELWKQGIFPVLAGGTGFYVRSFMLGLPPTPTSDPALRQQIRERIQKEGNGPLWYELKQVDPVSAKRINIHDSFRIVRALEVYYSGGKALSSYELPDKCRSQYKFLTLILTRPREELYSRIDSRVDQMFAQGLEQEVRGLVKMGYTKESPGLKAIGYQEFFNPDGSLKTDTESVKAAIKQNSHHYAKKQYTYMRGIPGAVTVSAGDSQEIIRLVEDFCLSQTECRE